jgi:hypothetical protein
LAWRAILYPEVVYQSTGFSYLGAVVPEAEDVGIASYIDGLAARGRYHFTTEEAVSALGSSPVTARAAIRRQGEKGRVAMPFRGFHVIVPPEYRALGCLPADQFRAEVEADH